MSDEWDHVKWLRRSGYPVISFIEGEAMGVVERDVDGVSYSTPYIPLSAFTHRVPVLARMLPAFSLTSTAAPLEKHRQ